MGTQGGNMKKPLIVVFSVLLIAMLTSACEINMVSGSGKLVTENRQVSGFTSVTFAGLGELNITQGANEGLTIEAEDNIMPRITTNVANGDLYIGFESTNWQDVVRPTRNVKFDLKVRSLSQLDLQGLGSVNLTSMKADTVTIKVGGAGGIKIISLTASNLTVTMSGAGNVDLAGNVISQTINLSGLGNYSGGDLDSQQTTVNLTGAGGAEVWARNDLSVKISGAGSVSYYGSPTVFKDITGVGVLNSKGNK
jgi:predicted small secreted protein